MSDGFGIVFAGLVLQLQVLGIDLESTWIGIRQSRRRTASPAKSIPDGLTLYNIPAAKGQVLHFTFKTNRTGHYAVKLFNASGQLVFQKGFTMQLNFMDERFVIPSSLAPVVYLFVLESVNGFREKRSILIQ